MAGNGVAAGDMNSDVTRQHGACCAGPWFREVLGHCVLKSDELWCREDCWAIVPWRVLCHGVVQSVGQWCHEVSWAMVS